MHPEGDELLVELVDANARVPTRATPDAAGADLYASEGVVIPMHQRRLIRIGVRVVLPRGTYGRVAPRSGLSLKGIDVGAGVVDCDYEGLIGVVLINNADTPRAISVGERVAQLICERIATPPRRAVSTQQASDEHRRRHARECGDTGFGSSGRF